MSVDKNSDDIQFPHVADIILPVKCQACGEVIEQVYADCRNDGNSYVVGWVPKECRIVAYGIKGYLASAKVRIFLRKDAVCLNHGDEDFVRESIFCPYCNRFPFGRDICRFYAPKSDSPIVEFNLYPWENIDSDGNLAVSPKHCAHCGKEIAKGAVYQTIGDEAVADFFLNTEDDNAFCSWECLRDALQIKTVVNKAD